MGKKREAVIKNSAIGFIGQIITMLFTFVTRSLFIKCIGVELLGLNSTFSSVLNTLSLAELGFQSAVVYNLYKPLHDNDAEEVNSIINILKVIYRGIGIFFIAATLLITPFLRFIVTEITLEPIIYVYFWLQALASVCTYFLAYKRAILYADQKEYISKTIDLLFSVVFNVLQCVWLLKFRSYFGYLLLKIIQTYVSNLVVHYYCTTHYRYLKKQALDKAKLFKIMQDVKDIFTSKIASFIYSSTDNLVISAFVSTVSVGFFVNYTTVTTSLKTLTSSVLSPIIPTLGNYLLDEKDTKKREKIFFLNTFVRYLMALAIVIPMGILMDDFVICWVGEGMLLSKYVVLLLCMDMYIHLVHSASMDFISSAGLFKSDKYIEAMGALCNIVTSLVLVRFLGIEGVLVGTVCSQIVFWFGRSAIVYKECLKLGIKEYVRYWVKNIFYIFITIAIAFLAYEVYKNISLQNVLLRFIAGGVLSEAVIAIAALLVFWNSAEMKDLRKVIRKK